MFLITSHLAQSYCLKCGEYKDISTGNQPNRPYPIHLCKYKKYKFYKYQVVHAKIFNSMLPLRKGKSAIPLKSFDYNHRKDISTYVYLIFRIRQIRTFFNMTQVLNAKTFKMTEMINLANFNIHSNTEFFSESDFKCYHKINYNTLLHQTTFYSAKRYDVTSYGTQLHQFKIFEIYSRLISYYKDASLFLCEVFTLYPFIVNRLLNLHPKIIMEALCLSQKIKDDFILDLIEKDITLLEHLSERKIKDLFSRNTSRFVDWYYEKKQAKDYFYLEDIMKETLDKRVHLLYYGEEE